MSESRVTKENIISQTTPPSSAPPTSGLKPGTQRNLINLSAAGLCFSFFLPWVSMLGRGVSGLDLQKHFESYKLVWFLPILAVVTLILNMAGQGTDLFRRVTGFCPFVILIYALNQIGTDLFKGVVIGGWVALGAGAALILIPSIPKDPKPS